jgi:ABC-type nitrate/sulfonate/bicarbonate transport system substrate-binding protein
MLVGLLAVFLAGCGSAAAPSSSSSTAPASASTAAASKPAAEPASAAAKPSGGAASASAKPAASAAAKPASSGGANALSLAITSQGMDVSPIFVAEKQGFLSREGLTVERSVVSAGATIATGVFSNSINVGYANASPILSPQTAAGIIVLATPSVHYPYSLLVAPDVKSLKDLQGKTVAVSGYNGQDDLAMTALLEVNNLPANSVKRLAIGGGMPARVAAMQAGQVQGALFGPPYDLTVQKQKFAILSRVYEDVKTPVAQNVIYTSRTFAQSHHQQMVGLLKALVSAIRSGKDNPEPTKELINQWVKADDAEALQASYDAYWAKGFERDPSPQPAAIQTNIDNEAAARNEKPSLKADQVIDASFMKEALAALPPDTK